MMKRYLFFDHNAEVVMAYKDLFGDEMKDIFTFMVGDVREVQADVYISPANSFGFMDGGIDLLYAKMFPEAPCYLRKLRGQGFELLVGQAMWLKTDSNPHHHGYMAERLMMVPTMRLPNTYLPGTVNVYLAAKALFALANDPIISYAIPGLGTACGGLSAKVSAKQVRHAYNEVVLRQTPQFPHWTVAKAYEKYLASDAPYDNTTFSST